MNSIYNKVNQIYNNKIQFKRVNILPISFKSIKNCSLKEKNMMTVCIVIEQ